MSSLARFSYKEGAATVWPVSKDDYGQPVYGAPYLIPAIDYRAGGDLKRDDDGAEFVPITQIFFEAPHGSSIIPKRGWYIKLGEHAGQSSPPSDAELIRTVRHDPAKKFGAGEIPDWQVMT